MIKSTNPIANPICVLRDEFDDWAVLFNPDTAEAVGLNPVGAAVWKRMDGRHSLEEIITGLKDEFNDVPETVLEEMEKFVEMLVEHGFVGHELASKP